MPYLLFWPDSKVVTEAGFASVGYVPCIFDSTWTYCREPSRYLRDRACLDWPAVGSKDNGLNRGRAPTKLSLKAYGDALCNFLEWCELRGKDWKVLDYAHDIVGNFHGYQSEMLRGSWSASGKGLSPATVNTRVDQVCMFLRWAHDVGLRDEFEVPTITRQVQVHSATSSRGDKAKVVESRLGKVRVDPGLLKLPTDAQMKAWRKAMLVRKGPSKALIVDLILQTGIRREEAVQWRLDTLPLDRSDWNIVGDQVQVTVSYGAKGQKFDSPQGVQGPARVIAMPLKLAEQLHDYRVLTRPRLRSKYVQLGKDTSEKRIRMRRATQLLFLSDSTGEPITRSSLYEAWKECGKLPYPEWSPHLGRHYWACKTLLLEVKKTLDLVRAGVAPSGDWITGFAMDVLLMTIQPQLGHLSPETTQLYLTWVKGAFSLQSYQVAYDKALGDMLDEDVASEAIA